jgi:hypothetical protein
VTGPIDSIAEPSVRARAVVLGPSRASWCEPCRAFGLTGDTTVAIVTRTHGSISTSSWHAFASEAADGSGVAVRGAVERAEVTGVVIVAGAGEIGVAEPKPAAVVRAPVVS